MTIHRDLDPWRNEPAAAVSLLLLIAVAGGLDVTTFLFLGGTFVSNQTGTVLLLAMNSAGGETISTPVGIASLLAFLIGAAIAARVVSRVAKAGRLPRRARRAIVLEALLVASAAVLVRIEAHDAVVVAPLAFAMGVQATLAIRFGLAFITGGYVTGTVTATVMSSPAGDRSRGWWWYGLFPIAAMALGGILVGPAARWDVTVALVICAVAIAAAAALLAWERKSA